MVWSGWVFFRSPSLADALAYFAALFGTVGNAPSAAVLAATVFTPSQILPLVAAASVAWFLPNSGQWLHRLTGWKVALGIALLCLSVRVMALQGFNPFLYFQF